MFFQISPAHKKPKVSKDVKEEADEIPTLILAPFTQIPKLAFQDVELNSLHEIKLNVTNKKPVPAFVNILFDGPEELEFSQSWTEQRIDVNETKLLQLYWYPYVEYSERHNLKVTCTKQSWNIPITFKSTSPKKPKKKPPSVLAKRISPSNKKKVPHKLNAASSKPQQAVKKQPAWNDKPYIPKKITTNGKENLYNNEKFRSSSNVSFNLSSPDNIRRFTFAVNKLGFDKEKSPNFDDSLEVPPPREALKGVQFNSTLEDFLSKNCRLDSSSYLGTPICKTFKPPVVSSEVFKKDQGESTVDNPKVIRNLSFEMNCEVQPSLNISSETRIIGNLSPESIQTRLNGSTFVKNNISTGTFIKEGFEITGVRSSLETISNKPKTRSGNHEETYFKFGPIPENGNLSVSSSRTYVKGDRLDRNSDSFTEKLKQLDCFGRNSESFTEKLKKLEEFDLSATSPNVSNLPPVFDDSTSEKEKKTPKRCTTSPTKSVEVFPKQTPPMIKVNDVHNLFPIKEEPTDDSLRRTQIKRKSTDLKLGISPCKRQNFSPETWSKLGGVYRTCMRVERATKLSPPKENGKKIETKAITYVERKTITITDPFILAATTAIDPFLTNTIYLDQEWIQKQEDRFKNWLNMLLTPPTDLNVSEDGNNIDAAKLWRECSQKEVAAAPTKEEVCIKYHTSSRLDTLRKNAQEFYNTDIIQSVLNRINDAIEKKKIEIRVDRNVHLDLSLQSKVLSLLLSYNPLWLRIALETIYGEKLKLSSNSDLIGLSKFLYERFFKDRALQRKYKTVHNPKYNVDIKKFMLKKYFAIVYFLDKAKMNLLIPHNPCLFRKNAQVKESREMLIQFTRDAITAAVGDITKYVKYFGYVVEHKQDYIHEFDYAVNSLGGDLRDGVRLTRVMELILLRNDLTQHLRVPAISRLQKIHNVKCVFESLVEAGYKIQHEIEPHHIVDGHREKTLSFLWQIIYKFQAPLVVETTKNIQRWWRSLPVCVKRMKLRREYQKKVEAATKIQSWFRHQKQAAELYQIASIFLEYMEERKRENAAIKIQSIYRMYIQRKCYIKTRSMVIRLQEKCRSWLHNVFNRQRQSAAVVIQRNVRSFLARTKYLQLKQSVLVIEKYVIATKLMIQEQQKYLKIKSSAIIIQRWYRATKSMQNERSNYIKLKSAVYLLQEKWRSIMMMRKTLTQFIEIKSSTILIQNWFRTTLEMRKLRSDFLALKKSVLVIEKRYLAQKEMKKAKNEYETLRTSTIVIQRYLRATLKMRKERNYYLSLKKSVELVQSKYRANQKMLTDRKHFETLKLTTVFIQRVFRATKLMQIEKTRYQQLKKSTIIIQRYFRGYILMKKTKENYSKLKTSTVVIQQRYRAYRLMCSIRKEYETLRTTVIFVQTKFRANHAMKTQREEYLKMKNSCMVIQRYFRGYQLMQKTRAEFLHLREVSCFIQQQYKAKLAMKKCREEYTNIRRACVLIQNKFRANELMKIQRKEFETLKKTVNFVKSKYIAKKKMVESRAAFQRLKHYVIHVQRVYRANKVMKIERNSYLKLRNNVIIIQEYVRGYLLMKKEKQLYITIRQSILTIQSRFRAQRMMIKAKTDYNRLKQAVLFVQRKFRANRLMKKEKQIYEVKRNATITIQTYYRSYLLMKKERQNYLQLRQSVITIQRRFVAYKEMCKARTSYNTLKKYVVIIQRRYRANKLMEGVRKVYLEQRRGCILIQKYYRGYLLMRKERQSYLTLRATVRFVEEKYAANIAMRVTRERYLRLKEAVLLVQRKFRANLAMKKQREVFLKQKQAAVKIQKYFRGYLLMKKERKYFLTVISVTHKLQRRVRGYLTRKKYAHLLTPEAIEERRIKKKQEAAATKIQAVWRGHRERKQSSKALEKIRIRSENATKNADPQESLSKRSSAALDVLVNEVITVPLIISALTDFEYVTRRSPEICNKVGPILPEQLYILIKSVGRSLPDIQICEISAYILINLCKYEQTAAMTWFPEFLDNMLTIMTHWCDKENMAFPSLCTLFWLFAHKEEYKQTILQLPQINQRLNKIQNLVLRKQKMVNKSESKMVTSRFVSKKPLYLPGLKPDWGFDYPKRPRMFMNSVQAIECLIQILYS